MLYTLGVRIKVKHKAYCSEVAVLALVSVSRTSFKLSFWGLRGGNWLTLCKFQVYSCIIHHLFIALFAYHPKSSLLAPCL